MYQYTECGLNNIWLGNGYTIKETDYGQGVSIDDVNGLHRLIVSNLIRYNPKLSGMEFRFLRKELGLSQKSLGNILGVSDQTIAQWEKGVHKVGQTADRMLRLICFEKCIDQTVKIVALIKVLNDLDAIEDDNKQTFEISDGWKQARVA